MRVKTLCAVVLAAGDACRFGSSKQLAIFKGQPLVAGVMRTAESVCGARSILVAGNDWQNVVAACAPQQGFFVLNASYRLGLSSSIGVGIRSVSDVADGVLLMLADQPLITTAHVKNLVRAWVSSPESVCTTAYADTVGPPVIFPRRYFSELMGLRGDRGAKPVLDRHQEDLITIEFADAAIDIDRPDDLTKAGKDGAS